jgi:predicted Holliday junction resolvase-like endonuclease
MSFLKKLQELPEFQKKIILWVSVGLTAFFLFFWQIKNLQNLIEKSKEGFLEDLQTKEIQERIENLKKELIPEKTELEKIKKEIEKLIKETEEQIKK